MTDSVPVKSVMEARRSTEMELVVLIIVTVGENGNLKFKI